MVKIAFFSDLLYATLYMYVYCVDVNVFFICKAATRRSSGQRKRCGSQRPKGYGQSSLYGWQQDKFEYEGKSFYS